MEANTYFITKRCKIQDGIVTTDNQLVYEDKEGLEFGAFTKRVYQTLQVDYPKFFKMDNLSKLAFLGAETILAKETIDKPTNDLAIVLSNATSSLDTDIKHQETIASEADFYPSPAVFVYTLANICLAEISIRHGLQAENAFFISPTYDVKMMKNYTDYLLHTRRAQKVLNGWVDYLNGSYKLVLYLVEKQGEYIHTEQNIKNLFI